MAIGTRKPVRRASTLRFEQPGFPGMWQAFGENREIANAPHYLLNLFPELPGTAASLINRPRLERVASTALGHTAPAAVVVQFTSASFTERTFSVGSNGIWQLDLAAGTATQVVTAAQFLAALAVPMPSTFRYSAVVLNKKLIVSDGVNKLWTWDGTSGGGLALLTNSVVMYGPITVHGGKIMGITNADRGTIAWSEENDPTIGYGTAPYTTNVWTLSQTGYRPLEFIAGTNEGLYYARSGSWGVIRGAAASDFVNASTLDALSDTVGVANPWAVARAGTEFWFVDQEQRPHVVAGDTVVPLDAALWRQQEAVGAADPFGLTDFEWYTDVSGFVTMAAVPPSKGYPRGTVWCFATRRRTDTSGEAGALAVVFDRETRACLGWVLLPTFASGTYAYYGMGVAADSSGRRVLVLHSKGGYAMMLGRGLGQITDTAEDGATVVPTYRIVGGSHGQTDVAELSVIAATLVFAEVKSSSVDVSLQLLTPAASLVTTAPAAQTQTVTCANDLKRHEYRAHFGCRALGRWARPVWTITPQTSTGELRVHSYTLEAAAAPGPRRGT